MVSGEVEIIDVPFPTLNITPVEPLCPNGEDGLIIIDDPAGALSWSFDNLNYSSGDSISNLSSGTYTTYISYLHCTDVFEITVDEPVYELIQLPQNVTLPMNVPYDISHNYTDSLKYTFNWSPPGYLDCSNCPMPTFAGAEENVLLSVIVTDLNGCIQEQGVQVLIEDRDVVYIPNAFSPNNDAVNDHFLPYTDKDAASPLSMMIFNRWGDKLYEEFRGANNPEIKGWDGRQSGDFVMPGVYIYAIEIEYSNGKKETKYGDLTLIR
jgi:gliding motility-associated-like protein